MDAKFPKKIEKPAIPKVDSRRSRLFNEQKKKVDSRRSRLRKVESIK